MEDSEKMFKEEISNEDILNLENEETQEINAKVLEEEKGPVNDKKSKMSFKNILAVLLILIVCLQGFSIVYTTLKLKEIGDDVSRIYWDVNDIDREVSSINNSVSEIENSESSMEYDISQFEDDIDSLNSSIYDIESEIDDLSSDVGDIYSSLGSRSWYSDSVHDRLDQIESEINSINSTLLWM